MPEVTEPVPFVSPQVRGSIHPSTPTIAVEGAMLRCDFIEEEAAELRSAVERGNVTGLPTPSVTWPTWSTARPCTSALTSTRWLPRNIGRT